MRLQLNPDCASFWVDYLRHFTVEVSDGSSPSVTINKLSRIRKLLDYIDLHYDTDIPLTKAAEILGYDAFHCSKTFKAITGVSFITYLNTVRIGKSLDMLKNDDRNILDIALDCGFNNARTFNRVFKEITQMTPSEYLQSMQQEHRRKGTTLPKIIQLFHTPIVGSKFSPTNQDLLFSTHEFKNKYFYYYFLYFLPLFS